MYKIKKPKQTFKLSRHGLELSHLFFTNDLVLFSEASVEQIHVVMDCLDRFCKCSGQHINRQMSRLYCLANVSSQDAITLSNLSGIPITNDLERYQGVPSVHGRVNIESFNSMLKRISTRFDGWRSRFLSLAGRHVLAKSVLSVIPLYPMQTFILLIGLCLKIEQLSRNFFWGGHGSKRKVSLVVWNVVVKKKECGGLGLRFLHEMNLAFLAKLGWRMLHEENKLWVSGS